MATVKLPDEARSSRARWRIRIAAALALSALLAGWLLWSGFEARQARHAAFLTRFKESFRSGLVELAGEPRLERSPGLPEGFAPWEPIDLYRITAPIEQDGKQLWTVWLYTCSGRHDDGSVGIWQFGYAEAPTEAQLATPAKRYISPAVQMVDGIPTTAGASATIVSSTRSVEPGGIVMVVASAPAGTTCELVTYPPDVAASPLPMQTPDQNGIVRWTFSLNPKYGAGQTLRLIVKCIEQRGTLRLDNSTEADSLRVVTPG